MDPATKPGYATTEFWLTLAAVLVGAVLASGIIPASGPWGQIVGLIASLLSALGYQVTRSYVKSTQLKTNAIVEANKNSSPR
jgi:F0F1-type ATP synthase assembly protein I